MRKVKSSRGDRMFYALNTTILMIFTLLVLYPLIYVVSSSFSSAEAVAKGAVLLWPVQPTLDGYKGVFEHSLVMPSFFNSMKYMIVGTIINVSVTILAAYPLSRKDFFGRGFFMLLVSFTMLFGGGLIPEYLLVRDLGMLNNWISLVIPGALSAYNVIIARTFFQSNIPSELLEAAQVDSCSDYRFFFSIVLPLSAPILGVITLFTAVGHWNAWFHAMLYLDEPKQYPLQLVLRSILILNDVDSDMMGTYDIIELTRMENLRNLLKFSLIVVSSLPVMILYPFVQRFFVKGIMVGSLKG